MIYVACCPPGANVLVSLHPSEAVAAGRRADSGFRPSGPTATARRRVQLRLSRLDQVVLSRMTATAAAAVPVAVAMVKVVMVKVKRSSRCSASSSPSTTREADAESHSLSFPGHAVWNPLVPLIIYVWCTLLILLLLPGVSLECYLAYLNS